MPRAGAPGVWLPEPAWRDLVADAERAATLERRIAALEEALVARREAAALAARTASTAWAAAGEARNEARAERAAHLELARAVIAEPPPSSFERVAWFSAGAGVVALAVGLAFGLARATSPSSAAPATP